MFYFVRKRTSGFKDFPELYRKILDFDQNRDFAQFTPNRPQILRRSRIFSLF
jgi:hypothetical protein